LELGIEPALQPWEGPGNALSFVVSKNLHRRHLTSGQRAMIAVQLEELLAKEAKNRQRDAGGNKKALVEGMPQALAQPRKGRARDQAAKILHTNARYVSDAKKLMRADPVLAQEVKNGAISLPEAIQKQKAPTGLAASTPAEKDGDPLCREPKMRFFTIGYGGHTKEEFLQILVANGVKTVVDVRLRPDEAFIGTWVKAKTPDKGIEKWLSEAGIGYISLIELGNVFLDCPDWQERYPKLLRAAGDLLIERLADVPAPFCLMCAEKRVAECHRGDISEFLVRTKHAEVQHLE
jgi:hypothetical protein